MTEKTFKVYSAVTGGFDNVENYNSRTTYKDCHRFKDERLNAKIFKVLSHRYISEQYSIWLDGNVELTCTPEELIELMGDKDVLVFKHPERNCIYDEAVVCKSLHLDSHSIIDSQVSRYRLLGWPINAGLASCRIIVRRNNDVIEQCNNKWWAEITSGSVRDQLSFPVVFDKHIKYIEHPDSYNNEFFTVYPHSGLSVVKRVRLKIKKMITGSNQYGY